MNRFIVVATTVMMPPRQKTSFVRYRLLYVKNSILSFVLVRVAAAVEVVVALSCSL